jgi:hypothetical protein
MEILHLLRRGWQTTLALVLLELAQEEWQVQKKTYPLFLIEAPKAKEAVVCFPYIRKGATACVKISCKTNHGKVLILTPVLGLLFTLRSPAGVVFIDPVMDSGLSSDNLFDEWMHPEKIKVFLSIFN